MAEASPTNPAIPGDIRGAFLLLGGYGILAFFPLCLVGSFVGPHILAGALFHLVAGFVSLLVLAGLKRSRPWAPWAGVALSVIIVGVTSLASIEILRGTVDRAAAIVPLAVSLLFLVVLVRLIAVTLRQVRCEK